MYCRSSKILNVKWLSVGMILLNIRIELTAVDCHDSLPLQHNLPCDFLDSIDITGGALQPDLSIIYNGTRFTDDLYGFVDGNSSKRVLVEEHIRGCVCKIKPCIRLCCPYGMLRESLPNGTKACRYHSTALQFVRQLHTEDNGVRERLINHDFFYVDGRPCGQMYLANASNSYFTHVI